MTPAIRRAAALGAAALAAFTVLSQAAPAAAGTGFQVTNLTGNRPGQAANTDPNLLNAWGVAFSATGPFWISDNHSGKSTVYDGSGAPFPTTSPLVVSIPSPTAGTPGAPTGIVWANLPGDFRVLTTTAPAKFIFSTEDGTIAAWSGGSSAVIEADRSAAGAVYKGLAIGNDGVGNFVYATDFANGIVETYSRTWHRERGGFFQFIDPGLPSGYAPFGIRTMGDKVYVTYAKQKAGSHDDDAGNGNGYVDVFDTKGGFQKRLISRGKLDSPWGLAMAPAGFGQFGGDLLVGNFGDGEINAYNPTTGAWAGTLAGGRGHPLVLPGPSGP